jgi:hypothetical protein
MNLRATMAGLSAVALAAAAACYLLLPNAFAGTTCDLKASAPWAPSRGPVFRAEAISSGPTCQNAVVTIVLRSKDGKPLWADAMPTSQLMTFQGIKTGAQMNRALVDWLGNPSTFKSSADLPPWKAGEQAPRAGEFPFYPEAGVDQETYEQSRAARAPVFCYVQGMESMSCVVFRDGGMTKIGLQTFPG